MALQAELQMMNLRTIDLGRLESKIGVNRCAIGAWTRAWGENLTNLAGALAFSLILP
jgi:uncharacterized BrkB/YihY/UPF0761 family membrane protein